MQPGRYTELFFLDEATALAAGHRACTLCRREDYDRLGEIWRACTRQTVERTRSTRPSTGSDGTVPREPSDITMRRSTGCPTARSCSSAGSHGSSAGRTSCGGRRPVAGDRRPAHGRIARVITPPSLVDVLRAGWEPVVPLLHPSALAR